MLIPIVYEVTQDQAELSRARASLNAASEDLRVVNIENEQLERYANGENFDEYLERFARDEMGYADPQERVFHVRPGN
jgi:cell division protein FtsB